MFLKTNKDFAIKTFAIDRGTAKPRKDIAKWSEVPTYFNYMFGYFNPTSLSDYDYDFSKITPEIANEFIFDYSKVYSSADEKDVWFNKIKEVAERHGFATDNKLYKANPENYVGNTADACTLIRLAITGRTNSPDLYSICAVLGDNLVQQKIQKFIDILI